MNQAFTTFERFAQDHTHRLDVLCAALSANITAYEAAVEKWGKCYNALYEEIDLQIDGIDDMLPPDMLGEMTDEEKAELEADNERDANIYVRNLEHECELILKRHALQNISREEVIQLGNTLYKLYRWGASIMLQYKIELTIPEMVEIWNELHPSETPIERSSGETL